MKRVTIKTYHDTRQKAKANGRWPVKLVVYCPQVAKNPKRYTLHWDDGEKCEVTPDEYRRATGERVPSALQPLAALIGDEMSRARKIVEGMQDFSHEAFARAFVGGTEPMCIINDLQTKAASFLTGSGANYRSAASALVRYTNKKTLSYHAITTDFARKFVTWLEQEQNLSGDTVRLYVGLINTMINEQRDAGALRHDFAPFKRVKFAKKKKLRATPLELDHWRILLHYESENNRRQFARDVFVLCTLLNGLYASDLLRIRREQVRGNWLRLAREKTEGEFVAFITEPAREILDRLPPSMPYLLPVLRPEVDGETARRKVATFGERINNALREIADELKIPRFTLRQARDTFATVSRNTGTREDVVSQLLAHSDLRTTKHYLGAFPEAEIEENARRIAGL